MIFGSDFHLFFKPHLKSQREERRKKELPYWHLFFPTLSPDHSRTNIITKLTFEGSAENFFICV